MAIDTSGKWWVGSEPEDIKGFLYPFSEDAHRADEFRLAQCACGSARFLLRADGKKGACRPICTQCGEAQFIFANEADWGEPELKEWTCIECGCPETNIGVGFSADETQAAYRWLYIGVRCTRCGVLGCPVGWKIMPEPSLRLAERV